MAPAQGWHAKSWSVPHFLRPPSSEILALSYKIFCQAIFDSFRSDIWPILSQNELNLLEVLVRTPSDVFFLIIKTFRFCTDFQSSETVGRKIAAGKNASSPEWGNHLKKNLT